MLMLQVKFDAVESVIRDVAAQVIVPRFRNLKSHDIHFKSADDPVTIADKEAEIALKDRLLDLLPGSEVVGEEAFASDSSILSRFSGESPVWIIDPVDGTKAFIAGEPVYGVIVALAERNQTVAGWLYDPTSDEFVTAEVGGGAYHSGNKLSVLPAAPVGQMSGALDSAILERVQGDDLSREATARPDLCRMLSACHDYARLVVGQPHFSRTASQLHFHGTHCTCTPWDSAAGVLINAEAGGYTAHWTGEPFLPSDFGRGILTAPDPDSWHAIREWISSLCALPDC